MRPAAAAATAMESRQRMLALRPMARLPNVSVPVPRLISLEMIETLRSALGQRPVIPIPRIEPVIDVPIKSVRPMKPGPSPNKYAAHKPVRPIISIGRAVIGCIVEIPIRAIGRRSDVYNNLRRSHVGRRQRHHPNSGQN